MCLLTGVSNLNLALTYTGDVSSKENTSISNRRILPSASNESGNTLCLTRNVKVLNPTESTLSGISGDPSVVQIKTGSGGGKTDWVRLRLPRRKVRVFTDKPSTMSTPLLSEAYIQETWSGGVVSGHKRGPLSLWGEGNGSLRDGER